MAALVLIGPPASGKSKLGKRLARALELPLIDTDKRIVAEHGPIPDIFAERGEAQFRIWEREAVRLALKEHAVVSLGGGAVLDAQTQLDLLEHPVLLLMTTAEAVAGRIEDGSRPLLAGGADAWQRILEARLPIYQRLADHTIDTSRGYAEDIIAEALAWAKEQL